jgi:hypothetical protein
LRRIPASGYIPYKQGDTNSNECSVQDNQQEENGGREAELFHGILIPEGAFFSTYYFLRIMFLFRQNGLHAQIPFPGSGFSSISNVDRS